MRLVAPCRCPPCGRGPVRTALPPLPLLVVAVLCAGVVYPAAAAQVGPVVHNFVLTDTLQDGERETRIHFGGLTAKETAIGDSDSPALKLRQITDGDKFVQLIYGPEGEIRDCEAVALNSTVARFLDKFKDDVERILHGGQTDAAAGGNVTARVLGPRDDLPADVAEWLHMPRLLRACRRSHRQMRNMLRRRKRDDADGQLQRRKRGLQEVLLAPGTMWCGAHHRASKYKDLGAFARTDRCCRHHDHCKMAIPGLSSRFGLFNSRPFTLSYCGCDKRFRTCLKMAGNGAANMVGKVFFNVVQTKCFVLKPKKSCVKRSWWGKCEKVVIKKQAHLRNNTPY